MGTLRYFPPPKNKVGRVATLKRFRGKGAGAMMLKGLEALLTGNWTPTHGHSDLIGVKQANEISCHAQGWAELALQLVWSS